jgi:hypothetical protein
MPSSFSGWHTVNVNDLRAFAYDFDDNYREESFQKLTSDLVLEVKFQFVLICQCFRLTSIRNNKRVT